LKKTPLTYFLALFRGLAPKNTAKDSAEVYLNHVYKENLSPLSFYVNLI